MHYSFPNGTVSVLSCPVQIKVIKMTILFNFIEHHQLMLMELDQ